MSLQSVIYSRLSGFAALTALTSTRIYPEVTPQGVAFPAVMFQTLAVVPVHSMGTTSGMKEATIRVMVWDAGFDDVIAAADQVSAALSRHSDAGADPVIHDIIEENRRSMYEPDQELHREIIDYKVILTG